jgi:hypothetical protein
MERRDGRGGGGSGGIDEEYLPMLSRRRACRLRRGRIADRWGGRFSLHFGTHESDDVPRSFAVTPRFFGEKEQSRAIRGATTIVQLDWQVGGNPGRALI